MKQQIKLTLTPNCAASKCGFYLKLRAYLTRNPRLIKCRSPPTSKQITWSSLMSSMLDKITTATSASLNHAQLSSASAREASEAKPRKLPSNKVVRKQFLQWQNYRDEAKTRDFETQSTDAENCFNFELKSEVRSERNERINITSSNNAG